MTAAGRAQTKSFSDGSTDTQNISYTVSGTVVSGLNGAPIPRALVRINARAVLTDALGHFSFPQFTGTGGSVQVSKQGYADSPDDPGGRSGVSVADLTDRLELKLYPNAVLTGILTGSDRLPVEKAQVVLFRETIDENGSRVAPAGFIQTDTHGEYRFSEPPGRYRVTVPYSQRANPDGTVMLPAAFPERGSAEIPATFLLTSGEQRRIDLHARTAASFPVRFRMEGGEEGRANPRITVRTAAGDSFGVFARNTTETGVLELQLPNGAYQLRAATQDREGRQEAEAHLTVAGAPVDGLVFHFAPLPSIPVEMALDTTASTTASAGLIQSSNQAPNLRNFNLRLQNIAGSDQFSGEENGLNYGEGGRPVLQVSPGAYRLRGQFTAPWYVRSATYGGIDLLTKPMTISAGADGEPIRLVVANDTGQLAGRVAGAAGSLCFVYLVAHQPGLFPVVLLQANSDGSFARNLPPGTYTAYAFPRKFTGDLRDSQTVAHLSAGQDVEIPAAGKASVDLSVQSAEITR